MNNPKIIMNYLPQFHAIPENSKWWGEGYTDWVSVKKAVPLYQGHQQPKVPMNEHYYSLDDVEEIKWQVNLAKKYGVFGFGIYHYWFSSKLYLLGKPAELLLEHPEIDISFLFLWDNCTWKRTWSNVRGANAWASESEEKYDLERQMKETPNGILAELIYGDEDEWKRHFEYLLPFFKDRRYIKIDNKPVFGFFQPNNDFKTIKRMYEYWDKLAKENGFNGIYCMTRDNYMKQNLQYKFRYSPLVPNNKIEYLKYKLKDIWAKKTGKIRFYDYDKCWKEIIRDAKHSDSNTLLSGFVAFDDTPRRGKNGRVIEGGSSEKFKKYLMELLRISQRQGKEYVFVTAWNEWGEGAYLEPDTEEGYKYLEAVKEVLEQF